MPGKKFKQRKTDVIENGIVYRMNTNPRWTYYDTYYVYTYTDDLSEKVIVADRIGDRPVTFLDTKCFQRSLCREVILPDSVLSIGSEAFAGCENLTDAYIPESVTTIDKYAFFNCTNLTIHGVPGSCAEKYAKENNISFVEL